MKVTIIPIVTGAFGTVTKGLLKGLEDLKVGSQVETIRTTALLKTARILRRVLETWGDLLSLNLLWKTISLRWCECDVNNNNNNVEPPARISLTLSLHFSLSFIASSRSSGLHPVSSQSCSMYVRAGRPAFARPYVGVHRNISFMSSSLILQQCPACLVRLTPIVFVMGGRWPYSLCFVGCCPQGLVQYCSQHSCVIAV